MTMLRVLPDLAVYLVLDPALCGGADGMVATARAAAQGGASVIQLRDKAADTAAMTATAHRLRAALDGTGAALIVNDDVDAALAAEADGVHVGQTDRPAEEVRARIGPARLLGVSVETPEAARAIDPALVDYVGAGPVFATQSKADHATPIGWDGLAALVAAAPVPAVAIGGVKADHAARARAAGAAGVAVVSAICGQPDPAAASAGLRRAWEAGQ